MKMKSKPKLRAGGPGRCATLSENQYLAPICGIKNGIDRQIEFNAAPSLARTCRTFAFRRHATVFASPEIAHKAELVEFDLRLLMRCDRSIPAITSVPT